MLTDEGLGKYDGRMAKIKMVARVDSLAAADDSLVPFINVDASLSAALMVDAYLGTIDWQEGDDEVGALAEIRSTVAGEYGEFIDAASLAAVDADGVPVSEIACAMFEGVPTILFLYTASAQKGRGHAARLIRASAAALQAAGFSEVVLFVTEGNSAQGLYEKLGFRVA